MSDQVNKNPLPRVVKGTGFYTPMDIAPGEAPASAAPATDRVVIGESMGLPTPINVTPPSSAPAAATEPSQGNGNNGNAQNN